MAMVVWVNEEVTSRKRSAEERNDDKRLNVSNGAAEPIETQDERSYSVMHHPLDVRLP